MTEIGMVRQVRESVFIGWAPRPHSKDGVPKKFWDPYLRPNGLTQSNQISYHNTHGAEACFGVSYAPHQRAWPSIPQIFGTSYVSEHSMINDNQILHGYYAPPPRRGIKR